MQTVEVEVIVRVSPIGKAPVTMVSHRAERTAPNGSIRAVEDVFEQALTVASWAAREGMLAARAEAVD